MSVYAGSIGTSSTEPAGLLDSGLGEELSAHEQPLAEEPWPELPAPELAQGGAGYRWGYFFFLVTTAILFNPPDEIWFWLKGWPLFQVAILAALAFSYPGVLAQFRWSRLSSHPMILCVLGMAAAIFTSKFFNRDLYGARTGTMDFLKVVTYFLMLLALVNTEERLRGFLKFTVFMIALMALQAMLGYYGIVHLMNSTMLQRRDGGINQVTGAKLVISQLQATGIFSDPNDFALVLVLAFLGAVYFVMEARTLFRRCLWIGLTLFLAIAFALTRSRGGLLSLLAGIAVWFVSRFGWRQATLLLALAMPLIFVAFAGRQTNINLNANDTAQSRIRLWRDGMGFIKGSPLFGIGYDTYQEHTTNVAHNSYIHCYAELGFFGGTIFFGEFVLAFFALFSPATQRRIRTLGAFVLPPVVLNEHEEEPEEVALPARLDHFRSTLIAIGIAYAVGLFSLSRAYACSTYLMLGMLCAMQMLIAKKNPAAVPRLNTRLAGIVTVLSVMWLAFLYVFVRLAVKAANHG